MKRNGSTFKGSTGSLAEREAKHSNNNQQRNNNNNHNQHHSSTNNNHHHNHQSDASNNSGVNQASLIIEEELYKKGNGTLGFQWQPRFFRLDTEYLSYSSKKLFSGGAASNSSATSLNNLHGGEEDDIEFEYEKVLKDGTRKRYVMQRLFKVIDITKIVSLDKVSSALAGSGVSPLFTRKLGSSDGSNQHGGDDVHVFPFHIITPSREIILATGTEDKRLQWIQMLESAKATAWYFHMNRHFNQIQSQTQSHNHNHNHGVHAAHAQVQSKPKHEQPESRMEVKMAPPVPQRNNRPVQMPRNQANESTTEYIKNSVESINNSNYQSSHPVNPNSTIMNANPGLKANNATPAAAAVAAPMSVFDVINKKESAKAPVQLPASPSKDAALNPFLKNRINVNQNGAGNGFGDTTMALLNATPVIPATISPDQYEGGERKNELNSNTAAFKSINSLISNNNNKKRVNGGVLVGAGGVGASSNHLLSSTQQLSLASKLKSRSKSKLRDEEDDNDNDSTSSLQASGGSATSTNTTGDINNATFTAPVIPASHRTLNTTNTLDTINDSTTTGIEDDSIPIQSPTTNFSHLTLGGQETAYGGEANNTQYFNSTDYIRGIEVPSHVAEMNQDDQEMNIQADQEMNQTDNNEVEVNNNVQTPHQRNQYTPIQPAHVNQSASDRVKYLASQIIVKNNAAANSTQGSSEDTFKNNQFRNNVQKDTNSTLTNPSSYPKRLNQTAKPRAEKHPISTPTKKFTSDQSEHINHILDDMDNTVSFLDHDSHFIKQHQEQDQAEEGGEIEGDNQGISAENEIVAPTHQTELPAATLQSTKKASLSRRSVGKVTSKVQLRVDCLLLIENIEEARQIFLETSSTNSTPEQQQQSEQSLIQQLKKTTHLAKNLYEQSMDFASVESFNNINLANYDQLRKRSIFHQNNPVDFRIVVKDSPLYPCIRELATSLRDFIMVSRQALERGDWRNFIHVLEILIHSVHALRNALKTLSKSN